MAKISLDSVLGGFNLQRINTNFKKVEDAFNSTFLRKDGDVLQGDIDANGHTFYNLATPVTDNSAARLKDVKNAIAGLSGQTANLVSFSPTADVLATNVQGAIQELADKGKGSISLATFKIAPNTGNDVGSAIQNAISVASGLGMALEIPGGEYMFSAGVSLDIDPAKTRIVGKGASVFRWQAPPTAGYAVRIAGSASSPYETAKLMVGRVWDGVAITGSLSAGNVYAGSGLRIGNGVSHTHSFSVSHTTVSGFSNVLDFTNNSWWITFEKCRLMWGTISTPATSGNWGESYTFYDCELLDGVVFTVNYGEWRLYGGSLDNSQVRVFNNADVAWHGAHFENPGQVTIPMAFIDIQGTEASVHLTSPQLVINTDGTTPINTAPFNVVSTNTLNGLVLDGLQYTQNGSNKFYSFVSGGGRVRADRPKILAFSNFNYGVLGLTMRGQLRNYGFEAGDVSGWTVTPVGTGAGASATTAQKQNEAYSCLLTCTNDSNSFSEVKIAQNIQISSGEFVQLRFGYKRDYSALSAPIGTPGAAMGAKLEWLDSTGAVASTVVLAYVPTSSLVVDASWTSCSYNGFAPAGTASARLSIYNQRVSATGTAKLYVDDVYVNTYT